jgi:peptidoglycan/LPS O-acetylase OafA/YrhL
VSAPAVGSRRRPRPRAAGPAQRDRGRLGALDGLRFLAAAGVVAFHFTARDSPGWRGSVPDELAGVGAWTVYGRLAVPLFFVISGFVILMSAWGRDVPGFVASRIGRLFPAYWGAVAISLVLVLLVWPENSEFFGRQLNVSGGLLNLTMLHSAFGVPSVDGAYWTLWYEARFYLLVALLMAVGITRTRVLAFTALWPVAGAVAVRTESDLLVALLMPDYAPFFAGGMLLYLIHRDGPDLGTWLLVALQAAIALHFAVTTFPGSLDAETRFTASATVVGLLTVASFALVAGVTLTRVAGWDHPWLAAAGALSYPLYLLHENLGWFVIHHMRAGLGAWGAVIAASIVVVATAVLLHLSVERPFGRRLRSATLLMIRSTGRGAGKPDAPPHLPTQRRA